jgi:two-component sensor histidine kinase
MALIHEKLYRSGDLARIDFAEYVEELATNLFYFYGTDSELIKLKINITDVSFDVNTAIPCGLIINELVSNCLKYAFPEGKSGEININLQPVKDKFVLVVSDNGVAFPVDLDFRNTETLGLKLVISLTNQLDGAIGLDRSAGTRFEITFSELKYKERR